MSILEISEQSAHLAAYRGFITLTVDKVERQRIPMDLLSAIVTKAHGITYTQALLVKLAEYRIPLVITDQGFRPVSMVMPIEGHQQQGKMIQAQALAFARKSQNGKLWQRLIQRKIAMQAAVLKACDLPDDKLLTLSKQVRVADASNAEGQAARYYFGQLLGVDFRRQRSGPAPNDLLNYGYMILRSALARYVCSAGLLPALGIFHHHRENAFALVDDLIEPYRPLVDLLVYQLLHAGEHELNARSKKQLVNLLSYDVRLGVRWESVEESMKILCASLNKCYCTSGVVLKLIKPKLERCQAQCIQSLKQS